MDKLKPCPFCGGEAEVIPHRFFCSALNDWKTESYGVACKRCNTYGYQFFGCKQHAIKAWNRRINDASVRHGHWIKDEFFSDEVNNAEKCSRCGELIGWFGNLPKYCPGCGALMDGGNGNG